jgi:hypothetical protein
LNGGIAYGVVGEMPSARCVCVTNGSLSQDCNVAIWHVVSGVVEGGMTRHFEQDAGSACAMTAITTWKRKGVGISGQDEACAVPVIQSYAWSLPPFATVDEASSTWHPEAPPAPPLPQELARNGCTFVVKLTVAGIVHPAGTTTLASPPPPLDTCPASVEAPEPVPPELPPELAPELPPTAEPLLEPLPAGVTLVPLLLPAGVTDPPLLDDPPLDGEGELPLEDELPPLGGPRVLAGAPLELLDDPLLPPWSPSNPDDDPPPDGAFCDWPGWELQAPQRPAPRTTSRPARCEWVA